MSRASALALLFVGAVTAAAVVVALRAPSASDDVARQVATSQKPLPPLYSRDRQGRLYRTEVLSGPDVAPPAERCPTAWRLEFDQLSTDPFEWVCYSRDFDVLDRMVNPLLNNEYEAARSAVTESDCLARFPGFTWGAALSAGGQWCRPGFDRGPEPALHS